MMSYWVLFTNLPSCNVQHLINGELNTLNSLPGWKPSFFSCHINWHSGDNPSLPQEVCSPSSCFLASFTDGRSPFNAYVKTVSVCEQIWSLSHTSLLQPHLILNLTTVEAGQEEGEEEEVEDSGVDLGSQG